MSKNIIKPLKLLDAVVATSNQLSAAVGIILLDNIGAQLTLGGTSSGVSGTISAEVSNDHTVNSDGSVRDVGTWITLTAVSTAIASGDPNPVFMDLNQLGAAYIRFRWTNNSSSAGTLTLTVTAKQV